MERFGGFLLHVCVICSFVCMIAKVLDWYNPYMDFYGHVFWAQNILYAGILILPVTRSHYENPSQPKQGRRIRK